MPTYSLAISSSSEDSPGARAELLIANWSVDGAKHAP